MVHILCIKQSCDMKLDFQLYDSSNILLQICGTDET